MHSCQSEGKGRQSEGKLERKPKIMRAYSSWRGLGKRRRAVQQQQQRGEDVVVVLDECRKGGWIGRMRGEANGSPTGVSRCAACGNRGGNIEDSRSRRRLGKRQIEVQQQRKRKLKVLLLYCPLIDVNRGGKRGGCCGRGNN